MANALALPHIFEISFDALTAAVGGLVILLAPRMAPALNSPHTGSPYGSRSSLQP